MGSGILRSVARNGQVKAELLRLNTAAQHHKAAEAAAQDVTGAVLIYLLHILLLIFLGYKEEIPLVKGIQLLPLEGKLVTVQVHRQSSNDVCQCSR